VITAHFRLDAGTVTRCSYPVDNDLGDLIAAELGPLGLVPDVAAFERLFVSAVLSTAPDADAAWLAFYRRSLARLEGTAAPGTGSPEDAAAPGTGSLAAFARIYRHAAALLPAGSLLDVGSCFGFFPLYLRRARPELAVVASDVVPGTAALAGRMAARLRRPVHYLAADATHLPLPDRSVDAVTLLHLLEHLPPPLGAAALAEAIRVARRRVVVAVPLEDRPDPTYGHVVAFTLAGLGALGRHPGWTSAVTEHDGGWLVLDRA